jgi:hypothetical protein
MGEEESVRLCALVRHCHAVLPSARIKRCCRLHASNGIYKYETNPDAAAAHYVGKEATIGGAAPPGITRAHSFVR